MRTPKAPSLPGVSVQCESSQPHHRRSQLHLYRHEKNPPPNNEFAAKDPSVPGGFYRTQNRELAHEFNYDNTRTRNPKTTETQLRTEKGEAAPRSRLAKGEEALEHDAATRSSCDHARPRVLSIGQLGMRASERVSNQFAVL